MPYKLHEILGRYHRNRSYCNISFFLNYRQKIESHIQRIYAKNPRKQKGSATNKYNNNIKYEDKSNYNDLS